MARNQKKQRKNKLPGSLYQRNGRWWWKVQLPGDEKVKARPLKLVGAQFTTTDYCVACEIAENLWQQAVYQSEFNGRDIEVTHSRRRPTLRTQRRLLHPHRHRRHARRHRGRNRLLNHTGTGGIARRCLFPVYRPDPPTATLGKNKSEATKRRSRFCRDCPTVPLIVVGQLGRSCFNICSPVPKFGTLISKKHRFQPSIAGCSIVPKVSYCFLYMCLYTPLPSPFYFLFFYKIFFCLNSGTLEQSQFLISPVLFSVPKAGHFFGTFPEQLLEQRSKAAGEFGSYKVRPKPVY